MLWSQCSLQDACWVINNSRNGLATPLPSRRMTEVSPLIGHHCAINCMEIRQWPIHALFSTATRGNQPDECVHEGPSSKPRLQDRLTSWFVRIVPTTKPRPHAFQTNRPIIPRYVVWVDTGVVKQTTIKYINWNIWYGTTSLDTTWTPPTSIFTSYFPMTHHSVFLPRPSWSSSGRSSQSLHHLHFLSLHLSDLPSPS